MCYEDPERKSSTIKTAIGWGIVGLPLLFLVVAMVLGVLGVMSVCRCRDALVARLDRKFQQLPMK